MTDDARKPFLSRWSQRKLAASREASAPAPSPRVVEPEAVAPAPAAMTPAKSTAEPVAPELPPVESLSFDSDFTPFLQPKVDESLRRQALRKLFTDPRFNVMDGLDVYIDDYTKSEPIPPDIVAQLNHAKFIFDPPKTRINAQGHVEDVPPEAAVATAEKDEAATQQPSDAPAAQLADDAPAMVPARSLDSSDALVARPKQHS